jgi:hypothetical protein
VKRRSIDSPGFFRALDLAAPLAEPGAGTPSGVTPSDDTPLVEALLVEALLVELAVLAD